MTEDIDKIVINGKRVFICEQHHHVLKFWQEFKDEKPYLLTFDHHTDLHVAFQHALSIRNGLRGNLKRKINIFNCGIHFARKLPQVILKRSRG